MSVSASVEDPCCPVIELRQYTLKPGQRDVLIELFDRHFIESQEATGMTIAGQFRDRQRPDRFVWIRGFADMSTRHRALEGFYGGPVWKTHSKAANATMIDASDVLLLKPARRDTAFRFDQPTSGVQPQSVFAGIYALSEPANDSLVSRFEKDVAPQLVKRGIAVTGLFVTESAPNTFTRLPVREGEHVFVWVGTRPGPEPSSQQLEEIKTSGAFGAAKELTLLNLDPTSRSRLGGGPHAARAMKHDFDFLHGSWDVHNRYLKDRLKRSTEWLEFEARSDVEPLLNGFGQLDRFSTVRDGTPIEAITLRLFDPDTGEWSLHWADTGRARVLLPPMVGRFKGGVGEFFGDEAVDGKKVLCRFHWTRTADGSPQWQQAFSDDEGRTWETNWIMTFRRR